MKENIEDIHSLLKEIIFCARTGNYPEAASNLNSFIQEIQPILLSGKIASDYLKKLSYSLETIFLMQKQKDWVAVADVIEYEFSAILKEAFQSAAHVVE